MDDLIRRGDVLGNINKRRYHFGKAAFDEAYKAVYKAPAVDAVHVVRCRECKYSEQCAETDQRVWCIKRGMSKANEWYCADGERKEDARAAD